MSATKHDGLPRFARKEVREVAKLIVEMGAVFDGYDASGHPVFKAGNEYITLPMTPSGNAWRPITIRKVRKALGIKAEKSTRGKYRGYGTGFRMPAGDQGSVYVDGLNDDHAQLSTELALLKLSPDRKSIDQARGVVMKLRDVESELRRMYQPEPVDGWYFGEKDLS